ncbi:MAG TPA: thiolase family protein [Burkholderiales bacterium]|nr:thiolase family protein [Burkholderiales bacterium]
MSEPVIVAALRTPFAKRGGAFRDTRPDSLLAHALSGVAARAGLDPARIDDVICGTVTQSGEQGANVGRLGALLAGFPVSVPAVSLNRMCGSSQQAVHFAAQAIAAGDARYAIACGVESMTRVRMFSDIDPDGRHRGFGGLNPDLFARHELIHQGESAERLAMQWRLSRAALDEFSVESHRRAAAALADRPRREILPAPGLNEAGAPIALTRDEGVREHADPAKMATLKPVFREHGGVITAGNSSQIADGASAVLVADRDAARADGLQRKARFRARVVVGSDPTLQLDGVIPATRLALERAGLALADLDWIEVNEAFACVPLAWAREFAPDMARLNPWGGAIAHGHPLGATGSGLLAKMLAGLEATGGTLALQTMCIGHGMATATIIERI